MAFTLITGRKKTEERDENITGSSYDDWRYISNKWSKVQNQNYTSIKNLIAAIATPKEHLCQKSLDIIKVNTFKPLLELIQDGFLITTFRIDANTQTVKGGDVKTNTRHKRIRKQDGKS